MSEDAKFDAMYEEEVQYLSNQPGGSRPNYPRPSGKSNGNQGWTKDRDGGWKERDWRDRGAN